jgi:thiol-disulfide isomerase/thioredoxin
MRNPAVFSGTKTITTLFACLVFVHIFSLGFFAQETKPNEAAVKNPTDTNLPKVTQIDEAGLKKALTPQGRPLLVNFWATWCDPCREEFPDLVKIDAAYKGKIDFITVSLDFPEELAAAVPKFLGQMKAEMPAYLLTVADENAVITSISKDWQGGMPFTVLYNAAGELVYFRQGKVKVDLLRAELDKLTAENKPKQQ